MSRFIESFQTVYAKTKRYRYDLSVNVNPLGPSLRALQMQKDFCKASYYPEECYVKLQKTIADIYSIAPEKIALGAGLDGLLHDYMIAFLQKSQKLVMPSITFQNPLFSARMIGSQVEKIPMLPDLRVDFKEMYQRLTDDCAIIFLCNPNNPTGLSENIHDVAELLRRTSALVLIDEANIEYSSCPSCIPLCKDFPNLVVLRSFSKAYGLAGMRIGYSISSVSRQSQLHHSRPPFNISGLSCAMAREALLDQEHLEHSLEYIDQQKSFLSRNLIDLNFQIVPSNANTLLAILPDDYPGNVSDFIEHLNSHDSHVINGAYFGLSDRFFRIAPNKKETNAIFIEILKRMPVH